VSTHANTNDFVPFGGFFHASEGEMFLPPRICDLGGFTGMLRPSRKFIDVKTNESPADAPNADSIATRNMALLIQTSLFDILAAESPLPNEIYRGKKS
jgi:hypothetical protein